MQYKSNHFQMELFLQITRFQESSVTGDPLRFYCACDSIWYSQSNSKSSLFGCKCIKTIYLNNWGNDPSDCYQLYQQNNFIFPLYTQFYTYLAMPCRILGCKENHKKHYCKVCKNDDASHFSSSCPRGTIIYHGTKQQYAQQIMKNGFQQSSYGRIGAGVYFTKQFQQAKQIALHKFRYSNPVVIECIAEVDFRQFNPRDNQEVLMKKFDKWYSFCKEKANQGIHPPWANLNNFKEVCVKDPKAISFRCMHSL